jgi:hypothetical protein
MGYTDLMQPSESCVRRGFRARPLPRLGLWVAWSLTTHAALAQDPEQAASEQPAAPVVPTETKEEAVKEPEAPAEVLPPNTEQGAVNRDEPPTSNLAPNPPATAPGATAPSTAGPAASGNSIINTVGSVLGRRLMPVDPTQDPRLRALDTSFPAEQPEVVEAPRLPPEPLPPRGPTRRTMLRTIDGITVLTNIDDPTELPAPESPNNERQDVVERPSSLAATAVREAGRGEIEASTNALEPELRRTKQSGFSPWVWALAGFAGLLLVPIGVLLTRPVRRG